MTFAVSLFVVDSIRITVLAQRNTLIGTAAANKVRLQCYPSNNDEAVILDFGRTAPIPSHNAAEPYDRTKHGQKGVYYVTIPDFGPFYCLGNKSGVEEKVSALYLRDDGKNS